MACTQVTIQNDAVLEEPYENFSLVLSHMDPAVHIASTSASVTIVDNDGRFDLLDVCVLHIAMIFFVCSCQCALPLITNA